MEVVHLKDRRIHTRISNDEIIVYYKLDDAQQKEDNGDVSRFLKEKVFGTKMSEISKILSDKGETSYIEIMESKIDRLIRLLTVFANPSMGKGELTAINISASGVRFRARYPFSQGDEIEVLLVILPLFYLIECRCKVIWSMKYSNDYGDHYEIATKYCNIDESDEKNIVNYVKVCIENSVS